MPKSPKKPAAKGYLHGFSKTEQDRLYRQARVLEDKVYEKIELKGAENLLEVGCGVGAQTQILLERFPHLKIEGVDASKDQLARARTHLARMVKQGKVKFTQGDARELPFEENRFDAAFICWFLEHVSDPVAVLKEVKRVLKPGSKIYCNEVFNAAFFLHPYSPATLKYWFEFNDHQWNLSGDPFVGGKLGNYLTEAGFQNAITDVTYYLFDNRAPKRRGIFIDDWIEHLSSGARELIKAKKVTSKLVQEMRRELTKIKDDPDSVIFYGWVRAQAQVF